MEKQNVLINYLVDEYFDGDVAKASEATEFSAQAIREWIGGKRCPQKKTIDYFIHKIFVPEFKVIVEFGLFEAGDNIRQQLKGVLNGHENNAGIYAFYDAMANLLYVGKATKLLEECYSAIRRDVPVTFPAGVKNVPEKRYEVVRYISAYDVGDSRWLDYPKHVESLILRISKPILNKQIGYLEKAYFMPVED